MAPIDFDSVFAELIQPALLEAGLEAFRADLEQRAGSIHSDMFQELLLADLVVADLSIDNANAWYELGVRHALRARGVVLMFSGREYLPFDVGPERALRYRLSGGKPDPAYVRDDRKRLGDGARRPGAAAGSARSTTCFRTCRSRTGGHYASATSTSTGRNWRTGNSGWRSRSRTTGRAMFFFSPKNRRLAFFNARLFVRRDALWSGWAGIGLRSRFSIGLSSTIPRISSAVNRRALPSADSDVMPKRRHGWKR